MIEDKELRLKIFFNFFYDKQVNYLFLLLPK